MSRTAETVWGATHRRIRVPVKSNPAAVLAAIKWASTVSVAVCAKALPPHQEKMASAVPMLAVMPHLFRTSWIL